jgi:Dolichol-phosphate mannosyltransferase subunit 3 (DPM3)
MADQPFSNARYNEYRAKYGAPGSDGWEMIRTTPRQRTFMRNATTFAASLMLGAMFYLVLTRIPPMAHTSVLPPSPWFLVVLIGILLFTTLGAMIMNLGEMRANHAILTRGGTALATALVFLGLGEATWQQVSLPGGWVQLLVMLLLAAAGATLGMAPRVSDKIIRAGTWLTTRGVWMLYVVGVIGGGVLGYALTSAFGCFAGIGALVGAGVGFMLVLRIRRVVRQRSSSTPTP